MDFVSHGLWGGIALGRKSKKTFWRIFLIGVAPDILSFGPFFALTILGFMDRPNFGAVPQDPSTFPSIIYALYDPTHSFIIFASVFFIIWLIFKKPFLPLLAWGIHVFMDIFTHTFEFFPTPFLWPISDFKLDCWNWGNKWIFIPNLLLLAILYLWFYVIKRKKPARINLWKQKFYRSLSYYF